MRCQEPDPGSDSLERKEGDQIKYKANDNIERYKAKLVANGFTQTQGVDYQETFALVAKLSTVRVLLSLEGVSDKTHFELQSDSKSTISIAKNPLQHDKTKHVEIDRHFIAEKVNGGIVRLNYVSSKDQLANILTKTLPRINFDEITSKLTSDDTQKSLRSRHRTHKLSGSCHKRVGRSPSCDSQSKAISSASLEWYSSPLLEIILCSSPSPLLCWIVASGYSAHYNWRCIKIDLSKLEMAALWRYWRYFNLVDAIPNPSKEQLVDVVQRHFMSQKIDELQVIVGFVHASKRLKTVCK
ncbi:hypothetical protein F3Y22_tig00116999pilonHSYRG00007 [Hibiscus syriacus]|uniref:Histone deacetylase complex subunit SAP30 Sin3 binding domain-containing protein n=1 Tax=Hibiscus syriacus TaxID=106335 RepID=A0A6A2XDR6_HIBSY|nr:hypothetical protein F3Y22_tig00116999pilonHSYRG00007 [Hibiscus syriacus]